MFFKSKKMAALENSKMLRVYVRIGDKEAEITYPLTPREVVDYSEGTLKAAVEAITDLISELKE
jgi:hypothetical protein